MTQTVIATKTTFVAKWINCDKYGEERSGGDLNGEKFIGDCRKICSVGIAIF